MSFRIYSIAYPDPIPAVIWRELLTLLPGGLVQKVEKYRRWQDAHGCLLGKHLLMAALREEGFAADLSSLVYSDYGRPSLAGCPDFSISHSGTRVACAIAKQGGVGLDLEEVRELDILDFKGQFSELEWGAIQKAGQPLTTFYHFWTAKECLSKADGRGLNLPLADLRIEDNTEVQLDGRSWNILPVTFFKGYACHVATEKPENEVKLKELKAIDLLNHYIDY